MLAACATAPAPVTVTLPEGAAGPACQALAPLWPASVSGRPARAVSVDSPAARAWGDPAIVAICGYPALEPTTLDCLGVDDVDWVVQPIEGGTRFTAYGRSPTLDVLVPAAYGPAPLHLPAFGPVARALPTNGRHCR